MVIMAALMVGGTAMAQQTFPSYIAVTGKAEKEVVPNEIYVRITIDETDSKGKVTVAEQERKMLAALGRLGIDVEKDLQVGDISGDLQTYVLRKDRTLTTKSYELKVKDANTLSKVFTALADLNISSASVTKATRSDIEELRNEMRVEAMKNAQDAARTLAQAVGQTVGKAFQITEYNFNEPVYYAENNYYMADMGVMAKGVARKTSDSPLDFKKLKVTHTVNVQFVLE